MPQEIQNFQAQFIEAVKQNSGMAIGAGVVVLLMGLLAMGAPFIVGLSVAMMVGIMLIAARGMAKDISGAV